MKNIGGEYWNQATGSVSLAEAWIFIQAQPRVDLTYKRERANRMATRVDEDGLEGGACQTRVSGGERKTLVGNRGNACAANNPPSAKVSAIQNLQGLLIPLASLFPTHAFPRKKKGNRFPPPRTSARSRFCSQFLHAGTYTDPDDS